MLDHDVYLAAFPGQVLASAFKEHGQRLLQKNVRAFLGLKVKKNKNIAASLKEFPQRFLAYNNGLTITVSNIILDNNNLVKVDDMQIVNGGQTIAVLADTFKQNDPRCLEDVIVAAKIIHVKNQDQQMRWIEKIAETSNTQNAIKDADLSSHNPVYVKIKELSNTTTFRKGTEQYKWYFSRVRNEYNAEIYQHKKHGRRIALKEFERNFPKEYVIEKGLIARVECVFSGRPWVASRGEAKCHLDFIENLPDEFAPDMEWYRNLISKILLIRSAENIAKEVGIREGRSCIVEYACGLLSKENDFKDCLEKINRMQSSSENIDNRLREYIIKTKNEFINFSSNRSTKEHAKREETWTLIQKAFEK
jgi:hypothetical protein